ncbi:MAG TPA: hypothetical protein VD963_05185, partial [Phycisphaerales bacterium]|nr:hypothetical protein [Phycisphaerales bacterium]
MPPAVATRQLAAQPGPGQTPPAPGSPVAARPWDVVPAALAALAADPHNHQLNLVLALNFARLGLRTPA